jgi:uncharacterized protein (TIGR03437 family)
MRFLIAGLVFSAVCLAQQAISVRNAASLTGGIAPGAIVDIQQLQPPRLPGAPDPSRVSVRVRPSGASTTLDAALLEGPLLSIWARLPDSTPLGPADITLTVDGQASAPARIVVTRTSPGLFTQALNGLGPALAQHQDAGESPVLSQLTNPARPGQYVILWGTGLGRATTAEVTVQLGGRDIAPTYAGPSPGFPGVDQINFQIPFDAAPPDGCYVSVIVRTGESISNEASIAKTSGPGVCEHPFGLSTGELSTLDSGGRILFGEVRLQSSVTPAPGPASVARYSRTEGASAQFLRRSAFDIALLAEPVLDDERYFGCRLATVSGINLLFTGDVDAGDALTLSGSDKTLTLPRGGGFYQASLNSAATVGSARPLPQLLFSPGLWRIAGPGGAAIGPFESSIALPPLLFWTNRDEFASIDRQRDQKVIWDPAGYSDPDVATIALAQAVTPLGAPLSPQILCRAPAGAGNLTIPSALLHALPATRAALLTVSIGPRPNRRPVFSLPPTNGSAARSIFDYFFSDALVTEIR